MAENACNEDHNLAEVVDRDDHHLAEIAALEEMDDTDDVDMVVPTAQPTGPRPVVHKKILTRKRLVNSIDNALNEANYDTMAL